MSKRLFSNKWLSLYNNGTLRFVYEKAGYFDERPVISLELYPFQVFIKLPIKTGIEECEPPRWGFYYYGKALWFCLGEKTKCIYMPWSLKHYRTSVLLKDGTWEHRINKLEKKREPNFIKRMRGYRDREHLIFSESHHFDYTLESGRVQLVNAEITVKEMEWRRRWFMFTSLFNKVERSIEVNFSDEVGEKAGTWKGGVVGCGYEMKQGETPLETLRRMEKERVFR